MKCYNGHWKWKTKNLSFFIKKTYVCQPQIFKLQFTAISWMIASAEQNVHIKLGQTLEKEKKDILGKKDGPKLLHRWYKKQYTWDRNKMSGKTY